MGEWEISGTFPHSPTLPLSHSPAESFGFFQGAPADEDGKAAEEGLLLLVQEVVAARAASALQHPFGSRGPMIDVAGIDVGAGCKEQVDHGPRAGEVERRLSIAAALVHARGIGFEHA